MRQQVLPTPCRARCPSRIQISGSRCWCCPPPETCLVRCRWPASWSTAGLHTQARNCPNAAAAAPGYLGAADAKQHSRHGQQLPGSLRASQQVPAWQLQAHNAALLCPCSKHRQQRHHPCTWFDRVFRMTAEARQCAADHNALMEAVARRVPGQPTAHELLTQIVGQGRPGTAQSVCAAHSVHTAPEAST